MKIAFIGTHGVGKTTLCYELAASLKKRDLSVELVREVARECPLPINRDTTLKAQSWILHTQIARELEAEAKLNPLIGMLYDRLGDAYVRNGQFEQARQALNKAVLLEPNATGPYILLGEALVKLGDPVQAMHYLNRAVKMDPGNYVTHNIMGQAYRALGQMADANREYKLSVEIQHRNDPKPAGAKQ